MHAYPATRWVNLKFVFEFLDQEAQEDATPHTSSDDPDVSQIGQTTDDQRSQSAAFVSLERNRWGLAGEYGFRPYPMDVKTTQTGWVTDVLSDQAAYLQQNPYLEFTFSQPHSSVGFTIHFEPNTGAHAEHFTVQTFDGSGNVISAADVHADNAIASVNLLSPNYTRVRFTFHRMSRAYSRLRIAEVLFGVIETYDADTITEATLKYAVDPIAESLPTKECVVKIDNSNQRFNLINPEGIFMYLQQPQAFYVSVGIGETREEMDFVSMGEFFFATASAEDASLTAEITAYDWFYWLDKGTFHNTTGGTWTLQSALTAILADAGIDAGIIIAPEAASTLVQKVADDMTHREAIRQAVQAACCTAYFDRENRLIVKDLTIGEATDVLDADNMTEPPKVTIESAVNTVQLSTRNPNDNTDVVYTASHIEPGELPQVKSVTNNMVTPENGQRVADWLLARCRGRLTYEMQERGNPETRIGDTVQVKDYFNVNRKTVVTMQDFRYDGGLKENSEAIINGN